MFLGTSTFFFEPEFSLQRSIISRCDQKNSFIQQIFVECLLYARHLTAGDTVNNKTDKNC